MKKLYKVTVREVYEKEVEVVVDDLDDITLEDEVGLMEANGEIEWDRADDFDHWDIVDYREVPVFASEKEEVLHWAKNIAHDMKKLHPYWLATMTHDDALELFESLRDEWTVPAYANADDIWEAVLEERKGE